MDEYYMFSDAEIKLSNAKIERDCNLLGHKIRQEIPNLNIYEFITKVYMSHNNPDTYYCAYCDKHCNMCSFFQAFLLGAGYTEKEIQEV